MKAVIVTARHMIFAPYLLGELLRARASQIAAIVFIEPRTGAELKGVIRRAGLRYFLVKSLDQLIVRLATRLRSDVVPVAALAARLGIEVIDTADVNSEKTLDRLREIAPDLLLSAFAPQIFKPPLIEIPSRACLNIHPSLLPAYAGIAPIFWVLANGEQQTGITVHHIAPKVDAGDVLLQARVSIERRDTVRSLYRRVCEAGSGLLVEAFDAVGRGALESQPQDLEGRSRFGNPNREGYAKLRTRGRRLF